MRGEKELLESLHHATSLIDDAAKGRISVEEFVKHYGNFYYYEALDGHEADRQTRELLDKYRELVSLHEEVQTNIVDLTYLGPKEDAEEFIAAGRIIPAVAAQKLAELASRPAIGRWLEKLRAGAE
jgi:hypothetical protein